MQWISCIGHPLYKIAPRSVREYVSNPRFNIVTNVDFPPLTGIH